MNAESEKKVPAKTKPTRIRLSFSEDHKPEGVDQFEFFKNFEELDQFLKKNKKTFPKAQIVADRTQLMWSDGDGLIYAAIAVIDEADMDLEPTKAIKLDDQTVAPVVESGDIEEVLPSIEPIADLPPGLTGPVGDPAGGETVTLPPPPAPEPVKVEAPVVEPVKVEEVVVEPVKVQEPVVEPVKVEAPAPEPVKFEEPVMKVEPTVEIVPEAPVVSEAPASEAPTSESAPAGE